MCCICGGCCGGSGLICGPVPTPPQVEPPGRGDALRHLRMADASGTSLWWRSYVSESLGGWAACSKLPVGSWGSLGGAAANAVQPAQRPAGATGKMLNPIQPPGLATAGAQPAVHDCGPSQRGGAPGGAPAGRQVRRAAGELPSRGHGEVAGGLGSSSAWFAVMPAVLVVFAVLIVGCAVWRACCAGGPAEFPGCPIAWCMHGCLPQRQRQRPHFTPRWPTALELMPAAGACRSEA